jgi:hypothetical protein
MPGIEFWLPFGLIVSLSVVLAGGIASSFRQQASIGVIATFSEVVQETTSLYHNNRTPQGAPVSEEEFHAMLLFWADPCLDCTYYGLSSLRSLGTGTQPDELCALIEGDKRNLMEMVQIHFDRQEGAFKHHYESWPTIYASLLGVRLSHWCVFPKSFAVDQDSHDGSYVEALDRCLGSGAAKSLVSFTRACELQTGGFAEFPTAQGGTVTTDLGYRLLALLGEKPRFAEPTVDFIWGLRRDDPDNGASEQAFGFANRPSDEQPTCAATRFAVRCLEEYADLSALRGLSNQDRRAIAGFLVNLQDPADGGFRFSKTDPWCVVQTWLALSTLKSLVVERLGDSFDQVVPPASVAPYLSILKGKDYRFGFRPLSPPNIHAIRSVIHALRLIEKAYPRVFQRDPRFEARILNAIRQHRDERTGMFVGYAHGPG